MRLNKIAQEVRNELAVFSSIPASMGWAVATITTVGYGEAYPITAAGKMFVGEVILVGLGIVAIATGLFAFELTKIKNESAQN